MRYFSSLDQQSAKTIIKYKNRYVNVITDDGDSWIEKLFSAEFVKWAYKVQAWFARLYNIAQMEKSMGVTHNTAMKEIYRLLRDGWKLKNILEATKLRFEGGFKHKDPYDASYTLFKLNGTPIM
jgi:hypothetical protein